MRSSDGACVSELERPIDHLERVAQLLLSDAERRVCEEIARVDERIEPFLSQKRAETLHFDARSVEGSHWLFGRAIPHELQHAEKADRSNVTNRWMLSLHLLM